MDAAAVYRRVDENDAWHWCVNCPGWPSDDYGWTNNPAASDDLCSDCQALELRGECEMEPRIRDQ